MGQIIHMSVVGKLALYIVCGTLVQLTVKYLKSTALYHKVLYYSVENCAEMREKSGCSRVMLAQGAMGNPWVFRELEGGSAPTLAEWKEMIWRWLVQMKFCTAK